MDIVGLYDFQLQETIESFSIVIASSISVFIVASAIRKIVTKCK